jgi:flagellar motor protein MotB
MASRWHVLDELLRRRYDVFMTWEPATEDTEEGYVVSLTGDHAFCSEKKTLTAAFDDIARQVQNYKEPDDGRSHQSRSAAPAESA